MERTGGIAPVEFFHNTAQQGPRDLMYAAVVFIIGSVVAVLTPFGGIGQLAGIVVFGLKLKDSLSYIIPMPRIILQPGFRWEYSHSLGPYFYLAIVAATLTIASFAVSVRFDHSGRYWFKTSLGMPIRERLLSISVDPKKKP